MSPFAALSATVRRFRGFVRPAIRVLPMIGVFAASQAGAQVVRGRVVEAGTATPVSGAHVVLLDAAGQRVAGSLTNEQGVFQLRGIAGAFSVRVEMIGRRSVTLPQSPLESSAVRELTLELPRAPVVLRGIRVTAGERCEPRSGTSRATETVWEEARKALSVEATVREQGMYRFDIVRYERQLNENGRVVDDKSRFISRYSGTPFTSRPAAELAERGYREVRDGETWLYGPNGDVLLSASFLDTHCFFLRRSGDHRGEIGLAFEPIRGRQVTDVEGVLWVDEETSELRSLEFRYTRMPSNYPQGQYGGRAEFQRLPNGAVIVRTWEISSPIVRRVDEYFQNQRITNDRVVGTFAEGGEVLNLIGRDDRTAALTLRAALNGMVWDSAGRLPIRGAEVWIEGTLWTSRTDAEGRYAIPNLPPGKYTISFTWTRPDRWIYTSPPLDFELVRGQTTSLNLATPAQPPGITAAEAQRRESVSRVGAALGNLEWRTTYRLPTDSVILGQVRGRVVDDTTFLPITGAWVSLEGTNLGALTDSLGLVPPLDLVAGEYALRVEHDDFDPHVASFTLRLRQTVNFEVRLKRRKR